jgi:uncharacterized protein YbdZ (MbtH family)
LTIALVLNDEGQYSIWPSGSATSGRWTPDGFAGSREDCLANVDEVDRSAADQRSALTSGGRPVRRQLEGRG